MSIEVLFFKSSAQTEASMHRVMGVLGVSMTQLRDFVNAHSTA